MILRYKSTVDDIAYATAGAAGIDLRAATSVNVSAGSLPVCIRTGVCVEIPEGYEGQVRPRSGLASQGIVAMLGTIDSDYRGEIGVLLFNFGRQRHIVNVGDRIAQLVIAPVERATLERVDELSQTERGAGGFGSTGIK